MNKTRRNYLLLAMLALTISTATVRAQSPGGKTFGFGIILGDPLGATVKLWTNPVNAFVFDIGASYFGAPRIEGDYLWHFDAFNSHVVKMYAGPGLAVGFGEGRGIYYEDRKGKFYRTDGTGIGFGARVIFGLNIIPPRTPLEIFAELGPLIGFSPQVGVGLDAAVGVRFYP